MEKIVIFDKMLHRFLRRFAMFSVALQGSVQTVPYSPIGQCEESDRPPINQSVCPIEMMNAKTAAVAAATLRQLTTRDYVAIYVARAAASLLLLKNLMAFARNDPINSSVLECLGALYVMFMNVEK